MSRVLAALTGFGFRYGNRCTRKQASEPWSRQSPSRERNALENSKAAGHSWGRNEITSCQRRNSPQPLHCHPRVCGESSTLGAQSSGAGSGRRKKRAPPADVGTVSTCLQQYARTRGREDGAIPGSARVAASIDGRESEVLEGEDRSGPDEAKGSSARSSSAPNSTDLLDPLRQIGHGRLSFCSSSRRKLDAT